jgi:hypothetical protein
MPQVVACGQCRQQFLAEDHLAGTVVACPSCGAALAIGLPAAVSHLPAPPALAASRQPVPRSAPRAWLSDLAGMLPADPRGRDRTVGMAVVAVACVLWLVAVAPSLPFLLTGFNSPGYSHIAGRIGALSVGFWVGILAACGGLLEWSFFMESRKMRVTREWFGHQGARWFLMGIGGLFAVVTLLFLGVPQLMALGSRTRYAVQGSIVPRPTQTAPAPPPPPLAQSPVASPAAGEVASPPVPAASDGPVPHLTAAALTLRDPGNLPGTWRRLEAGYGIKLPASVTVHDESLQRRGTQVDQQITGRTKVGKDGIVFAVRVEQNPAKEYPNIAQLIRQDAGARHLYRGEAIEANGLLFHKSDQVASATEQYNDERFVHRGVRYHFAGQGMGVWIDVRSRFPPDHPDVLALLPYAETLQPVAAAAEPPAGSVADGRWQGQWRSLPGGLCILIPSSLELEKDIVHRPMAQDGHARREIRGKTPDGTELDLVAQYSPQMKWPNLASRFSVHDSRMEMAAVKIHGLLFTRTSHVTPGDTRVEYQFREGPHDVSIRITTKGEASDPSLQSILAYVETIQRAPAR